MWKHSRSENGTWHWFYALPSGWHAGVRDDAQSYEPPRPTRYSIFAASAAEGLISSETTFEQFEDAKREALSLAMAQPDVKTLQRRRVIRRPSDGPAPEDPTTDFEAR